ncbi:MAG: MetQ/NlpA family ABC transporter substrate-binding protein [Chloroflexota bacterium]
MKYKIITIALLAWVLSLTACSENDQINNNEAVVENSDASENASQDSIEMETLKIAVLPILDALPLYVAQEQGYFADQNLIVELVPVNSGPERDQLMQAGQVDAMINELVSVLFYNQNETKVMVVRFARTATAESPVFSILAAAGSGIETVEDLAGVEIGVSQATVIEYMTDRVLENAGLSAEEIIKIAVPRIPDRLALLQSGELAAATLPDPVTALAILNGATLIIDDSSLPEVGTSVFSFSVETLSEKPEAVEGFLAAVEQAVEDLNSDPGQFDALLAELGLVPVPLQADFELPQYVTASVPSEAQWQDALAWALGAGLIETNPAYADSVTADYLP